jgi:hypothetical protein
MLSIGSKILSLSLSLDQNPEPKEYIVLGLKPTSLSSALAQPMDNITNNDSIFF